MSRKTVSLWKKCSFLDFFELRTNFFRTTCWAFSVRLWKLHFRCPDKYVEDKFLLQKKMFFVHFWSNKTLHSSKKNLAVWPKRKRRLICPQDHFEEKNLCEKFTFFNQFCGFERKNVKNFVWSFSSRLSQLFSKCPQKHFVQKVFLKKTSVCKISFEIENGLFFWPFGDKKSADCRIWGLYSQRKVLRRRFFWLKKIKFRLLFRSQKLLWFWQNSFSLLVRTASFASRRSFWGRIFSVKEL